MNFQKLLKLNVCFLQGKINKIWYHNGPVDDETIPLLGSLIELNKLGYLTTQGQPFLDTPEEKQIPYVSGLVTLEKLQYIYPKLYRNKNLLFQVSSDSLGLNESTIPYNSQGYFNLSKFLENDNWVDYTNMFDNNGAELEHYQLLQHSYPGTYNFQDCATLTVIATKDIDLIGILVNIFN